MQFERNNKGLFIKKLVMSILAFCFLHNNEFVGIIFIIYMILFVTTGIICLWNFSYSIVIDDGMMIIESEEEEFRLSFEVDELIIKKHLMSMTLDDGLNRVRISSTKEMYKYIEQQILK